jgi:hypothetical protein
MDDMDEEDEREAGVVKKRGKKERWGKKKNAGKVGALVPAKGRRAIRGEGQRQAGRAGQVHAGKQGSAGALGCMRASALVRARKESLQAGGASSG